MQIAHPPSSIGKKAPRWVGRSRWVASAMSPDDLAEFWQIEGALQVEWAAGTKASGQKVHGVFGEERSTNWLEHRVHARAHERKLDKWVKTQSSPFCAGECLVRTALQSEELLILGSGGVRERGGFSHLASKMPRGPQTCGVNTSGPMGRAACCTSGVSTLPCPHRGGSQRPCLMSGWQPALGLLPESFFMCDKWVIQPSHHRPVGSSLLRSIR